MLIWLLFLVLICILLFIDLAVLNRHEHVPRTREALTYTLGWTILGMGFSLVIYYLYQHNYIESDLLPRTAAIKYITGYLVELSLSMDNVFVIALIFAYFKTPGHLQHRVLFWGILGAIFFRGVLILLGVWLIEHFQWMMYVFGLILLYSAYRMLGESEEIHPAQNPVIQFLKRIIPVTTAYEGNKFFVRRRHLLAATPLFVSLLMVETTDIIFAFDSIPAILGITTDPFLVFSSNMFAVLGLRSLYFVIARMLNKFRYVKYGLVGILFFVGIKLLLHEVWHPDEWVSLLVIVIALLGGIIVSLVLNKDVVEETNVLEETQEGKIEI